MNGLLDLLTLGARGSREVTLSVPDAVLGVIVRESAARGGRLGLGTLELARQGFLGDGPRRDDLPGSRDPFWVETSGGDELSESLRLASGVVLSSWAVRDELKKARFAERRRLWEVESLRAIGQALGGTLEQTHIAEELLMHSAALLDARRGEVWLTVGEDSAAVIRLAGPDGAVPCSDGSCIVAARVGGAVLTVDETLGVPDTGLLEGVRIAVPILGQRGRLGVLALAEREVRGGTGEFGATDTETLALFATQAAVALENATLHQESLERERLERELELAAVVQRELLPTTVPGFPGFDIAARCEPSRRVGGDVYDLSITDRGLFFMLGDVAGKGIPAALMAASLQAAARVLLPTSSGLSDLADQLHRHLLATTPANKFATIVLGYLAAGGELEYVSAGHNPVVRVRADGGLELLGASGPPLGLLPDVTFRPCRILLSPGEVLLAYTDGLSEAPSRGDEEFGVDRIASLAARERSSTMAAMVGSLFVAVNEFTDGAPPHDDRTVLAIRRRL